MIIYMRKRDKEMCRIVERYDRMIYLRYEDDKRARRAGDWWVTPEQLDRLYSPWIDTDDVGDEKRGAGE